MLKVPNPPAYTTPGRLPLDKASSGKWRLTKPNFWEKPFGIVYGGPYAPSPKPLLPFFLSDSLMGWHLSTLKPNPYIELVSLLLG